MTERPSQAPLFVYFIHDAASHAIKIGLAKDVERRLSILQIGNPNCLQLIAVIPGDERLEHLLHYAFMPDRIRGEWFRDEALLPIARDAGDYRQRCAAFVIEGSEPPPVFSDLALERLRRARERCDEIRAWQEEEEQQGLEEQAPDRRRPPRSLTETQAHLAQRIRDREARRRK